MNRKQFGQVSLAKAKQWTKAIVVSKVLLKVSL